MCVAVSVIIVVIVVKILCSFLAKTSNVHNLCSSYRNKANFTCIWGRIYFSLQCLFPI